MTRHRSYPSATRIRDADVRRGGGIAAAEGALRNDEASGHFRGTGGLTKRQQRFVTAYVENGGHGSAAAADAGYSVPRNDAWRLLRQPHVQDAVQRETARVVLTEGAMLGVSFLMRAVDDPAFAGSVRLRAAVWLAEAGGYGLAAHRANFSVPAADKEPHEMSETELAAFVAACAAARNALEQELRAIEGAVDPSSATVARTLDLS